MTNIENNNWVDNSPNKVSDIQVSQMLASLQTQKPELSQFAKQFQDNLKTKNFPDQSSELVAAISVLSEISDQTQLQLAQQIILKTNIKPSLLAEKMTQDNEIFLPYYLQKLQANKIVDEKLDLMKKPEWVNEMEWKLKTLFGMRVWGLGKDEAGKGDFYGKAVSGFKPTEALSGIQINFLKQQLNTLKKQKWTKKPEYIAKKKQLSDLLNNKQEKVLNEDTIFLEEKVKIYTETKESEAKLKQKYANKIPEKLSEAQQTETLQKYWITDKSELEEKIKTNPTRSQTGMQVSEVISFLYTQTTLKKDSSVQNDSDFVQFQQKFAPIQSDLDLHEQNPEMKFWWWQPPVPAEDLQNLSPDQSAQIIENTDGMQQAVGWTVETIDNYDSPDLQNDPSDSLENTIFSNIFDHQQESELMAVSQNTSVEQINQAKQLLHTVQTNYKGDNFQQDIQLFVQTLWNSVPWTPWDSETQNPINQLLADQKTPKKDFLEAIKTLNHKEKTLEHGKTKIAKYSSNLARTTAVGQFMKTVAGNLTSRIGDTNLWTEVKVDTNQMKLAPDGTRSTQITYGGAVLSMQINSDGEVKMTDLLNNDTNLQKKLDWLDVRLPSFGEYVSECQSFVQDPAVMQQTLSESVETNNSDSTPFSNFQKNIKKSLFSHIDSKLNTQVSANKDFTQTMLAHHLSQQKAKNELFNAFPSDNPETTWFTNLLNNIKNGKENGEAIWQTNSEYSFLKHSLNQIDSNSIDENQQLTQTFSNLKQIISLR